MVLILRIYFIERKYTGIFGQQEGIGQQMGKGYIREVQIINDIFDAY
jgi:hypothetical protein